jgi:hypothetical protein
MRTLPLDEESLAPVTARRKLMGSVHHDRSRGLHSSMLPRALPSRPEPPTADRGCLVTRVVNNVRGLVRMGLAGKWAFLVTLHEHSVGGGLMATHYVRSLLAREFSALPVLSSSGSTGPIRMEEPSTGPTNRPAVLEGKHLI